jgi:hypothetical protein
MGGRRDEAQALLKELEGKYNKRESLAQYVAAVYAGLGDKDSRGSKRVSRIRAVY